MGVITEYAPQQLGGTCNRLLTDTPLLFSDVEEETVEHAPSQETTTEPPEPISGITAAKNSSELQADSCSVTIKEVINFIKKGLIKRDENNIGALQPEDSIYSRRLRVGLNLGANKYGKKI